MPPAVVHRKARQFVSDEAPAVCADPTTWPLPTRVDANCATIVKPPDGNLRAVIPEDGLVISEEMCRSGDLPGVVDGDCISILVKDRCTSGQLDDGILRRRGLRDDLHCRQDEQRGTTSRLATRSV
jgi:hypothetical protein